jgi:cellulose synthase/poly-beta-1,6-N-acetylglucosamine synthase-like glycosyltransferase
MKSDNRASFKEFLLTWALRGAIGLGCISFLYYLSWWFEIDKELGDRWRSPYLVALMILAILYGGVQLIGNWYLYLVARRPKLLPTPPPNLSVDVFVTACGEPYALVERSLKAACAMRGKHVTWLLDDGSDAQLARLAEFLGAGYLTRDNHINAKAGNVNAALAKTNGDIIAIFDIDHVPKADFLEKTVAYFSDPAVGFVQVMLTFANTQESWVADAAIETSLEYYNPTSLGSYGIGGATLMGSNALIRRAALESIGGYQPGLAEDLATSINLHAAGWKSVYVAEPLAPGIAPPTFEAWFVQQLKWARGVFELLVTSYPQLFPRLTWGQRLSYLVRMTKYWIGPAVALHLFATIAVLIFGDAPLRGAFHSYLIHIAPLVGCDAVIRYLGLYKWRHHTIQRTSLLRAVVLVYATWPIYLSAWLMALFRVPLAFRPTPKSLDGRLNPIWLAPQLIAVVLLSVGLIYTVAVKDHRPSLLLLFAILQGALQSIFLARWMSTDLIARQSRRVQKKKMATNK